MENQKLQLSPEAQKAKLFFIWVVKQDDPIGITLSEYNGLLISLSEGKKFAKIGWNVIMLNSITLIRPIEKPRLGYRNVSTGKYENEDELKIWLEVFNLPEIKKLN